jgi:hypothetical protein
VTKIAQENKLTENFFFVENRKTAYKENSVSR